MKLGEAETEAEADALMCVVWFSLINVLCEQHIQNPAALTND